MRVAPLLFGIAMGAPVAAQTAPTVTRKLTIGCESCGDASQFGSIYDVGVAATGDVLVSDRDVPMLRRFDPSGKLVWKGGAKGRGPGEFILPIRSVFTPSGMLVIDMTTSRLTELKPDGTVAISIPLTAMATTTATNKRGDVALGFDDFGRAFRVVRRGAGAADLREIVSLPGSMKNKSVALGPEGSIAVALDGLVYEILRFDASGKALSPIRRELPRPRRTAVEEGEYRQRLNRDLAMVAAEAKKAGGDGKVKALDIPAGERGLKGHITVDGLRYDDTGRLWVLTQRGDETKSVIDVFGASGAFLGEVTVPMRVSGFNLGGSYLVTAGENEDGIPVVVVWVVSS